MLKLDPDDERPPYRQLMDGLRSEIEAGEIAAGEKLPSYGAIATSFGVSVGVVKRAMTELRDEQVIVIRHGQGSFVRTEPVATAAAGAGRDIDVPAAIADLTLRLEAVEQRLSEL